MRVRLTEPIEWKSIDRPFAPNLPETVLDVTEDDTFSDLIGRALEQLDPDAKVIPFWPTYDGGPPPTRATLVRLGPLGKTDRGSEAVYVHEDPVYGVRDDGTVFRAEAHYPHPFLMRDLLRAAEAGYSDRDFLDALISRHHGGYGGGAPSPDWLQFLAEVGVGVAGGAAWDGVKLFIRTLVLRVRGLRRRHVDRLARAAVARWSENGFDYPQELREWIDKKTRWDRSEVALRLAITEDTAMQLLFSQGYDADGATGAWVRSANSKARRRRRYWLKREFRQSMGRHWRRYWRSSGHGDL